MVNSISRKQSNNSTVAVIFTFFSSTVGKEKGLVVKHEFVETSLDEMIL
ncbi:MAG: hypothetical protein ACFFBQ_19745 [Promethearchaeota archaeon]